MRHEFFPQRIKKMIAQDRLDTPRPTLPGGFLPDLVNQMKDHLRKIELAQIAAVQEYKDVCRASRSGAPRRNSKIWQQIYAARKASKKS